MTRLIPPEIPDEPKSEPPYLNSTASWYSGDAWFLFREIVERCGLPTAKYIFEKCVSVAEDQEDQAAAIAKENVARRDRAPLKLPTADQIAKGDKQQICVWWARLRGTDQEFDDRDRRLIAALAQRYIEVGGYPRGFDEKRLPPIPKRRNERDAVLVEMFDRSNPNSAYSIERNKRGGKLSHMEFAATLVPAYGASVGHVLRKLRYQRSGR